MKNPKINLSAKVISCLSFAFILAGTPARADSEVEAGAIMMFAGNFEIRDWTDCNGQIIEISKNQPLFEVLGTRFGGDGRKTFGLPDLSEAEAEARKELGLGEGDQKNFRYLIRNPLPGGSRSPSDDNKQFLAEIRLTPLTEAPKGWAFCDGSELEVREYSALYSVIRAFYGGDGKKSFALPNLRAAEAKLESAAKDGGEPAQNRLRYMICTSGEYPSSNVGFDGLERFIAEVTLFAGNFAPRGWGWCDGAESKIAQDGGTLFSLLGTVYGGDGRTTFRLPDCRKLEHSLRSSAGVETNGLLYLIQTRGRYPARH